MNDFSTCNDRDFLATYIYDEYKTAHGIRPRWMNFDAMSIEELREEAQRVSDDCDAEEIRRNEAHARAAVRFEALLADMVAMGAGDRATAIRWLRQAQDEYMSGDDDIRYDYGLDWGYPL